VKKVVVVLALIAAVWGGKTLIDATGAKMNREEAQNRVRVVLTGLQQGASAAQYQTAICMWWDGSYALGQEEFRTAADAFDAWARDRRLTNLQRFDVGEAVVEKAGHALDSAIVVVKGSVDGRSFLARGAKGKPLTWEQ
jgi:hypothetical protein